MYKSYLELINIKTFEERYKYLRLGGNVGKETFGFDRYLNQNFYKSREWKSIRDSIIVRDNGCDLGIDGRNIFGRIYIHHINPIEINDIVNFSDKLLDPNNLICCTYDTHVAIHYGDENLLMIDPIERSPNDTCPWK